MLFRLTGYHEWMPGVLAALSCLGCAFVISQIFLRSQTGAKLTIVLGLLAFQAISISTLAILGMEHASHVLMILILMALWLQDERSCVKWCICASLATALRYESLFVLTPLCVAQLTAKRYRQASAIAAGTVFPIAAYGAFAIANGGCFLPNSLMVKAVLNQQSFWNKLLEVVLCVSVGNPQVFFAGVLMLAVAFTPDVASRIRVLAISLAASIFGHLFFAKTGWQYNVYRYETYLLACAFVVASLAMVAVFRRDDGCSSGSAHWRRSSLFSILLVCVIGSSAAGVVNAAAAFSAPRSTFEMPMTVARIFATLPDASQGAVYLNDLGLIAERTHVPVIDVCGLGEQDTFNLIVNGIRNDDETLAVFKKRQARYAAVFHSFQWTTDVLRKRLKIEPVATLTSPVRGVWVDAPLGLYAFNPEDETLLARHVARLPFSLPKEVSLSIRPDLRSVAVTDDSQDQSEPRPQDGQTSDCQATTENGRR